MLPFIFMVLKYLLFAPCLILLKLFTWMFCLILALPVFVSQKEWKGEQREFLVKELRYFQAYDCPVDEWWHGTYREKTWGEKYTVEDFQKSSWLRYRGRIEWLIRNPADGFAQYLFGYSKAGMKTIFKKNWGPGSWDSGKSNYEVWVVTNDKEQYAFNIKLEHFFSERHYLRLWIGWKLCRADRNEEESNIMLAVHFNPFRTYSKQVGKKARAR